MPRDGLPTPDSEPAPTLPPGGDLGTASSEATLPKSAPATPPADETKNAALHESTITLPPPAATLPPAAPSGEEADSAATLAPRPDAAPLPPLSPTGITTGAFFGDYQVLETIAKGGMGIVFKARQRKLNRIVAIKMILAGQFANKTDINRFYTEAEAAAALSHPNIVKIHEIGEVQGQHFFSMEYIEGHSLADLVRESPLTPRRAAEFARTIAETMQFAHERGIVHRDLKPSNVLIDQQQRPLITDFGLAKHQENESQITVSGAVIGTPSYMPPEQAEGKGSLIGPTSDIYSLGAILYELVAGRPPFRAASPFETIRQVIQDEPVSPRLINPGVPKDLETICLKCLQKDQIRRYATSQELADELGRFLRGEPINARPISQLARLWRICKRYPVTATAICAAALLLITTAVVSTSLSITTARALAQSEESRRNAMAVVDELFTQVSESALLNQPGMQPLRRDLLERALAYYQKFLHQRANDPRVQVELASAMFRVGLITEALESPDRALPSYEAAREMQVSQAARHPDNPQRLEALGNTLNAIGTVRVKQRRFDLAREEYREAIRRRARLVELEPANSEYQRVLANTHMNLGVAELNAQSLPAARLQFEQAQKIRQQALAADAANVKLRRDLGKGFFNLGNLESADGQEAASIARYQEAAETFEQLVAGDATDLENQKLLAICCNLLGDLLRDGDPSAARQRYQQALDGLTRLAEQNPDVVDFQSDRAGIYISLSQLEYAAGNGAAVLDCLNQARGILAPLAERFPAVPRYQQDLAVTLRELAIQQAALGKKDDARKNLDESEAILKRLVSKHPEEERFAEELKLTQEIDLSP